MELIARPLETPMKVQNDESTRASSMPTQPRNTAELSNCAVSGQAAPTEPSSAKGLNR